MRVRSALALFVALLLVSATQTRADTPPNIVLVLTDDLNTRLLKYLPSFTDELARSGLTLGLTVPTPLCVPARASILTGKYAHNHGAIVNGITEFRARANEERTFAVALQAAGYTTGFFGKYLNGYERDPYVPPGWTRWVSGNRWSTRHRFSTYEDGGRERQIEGMYDVDFFAREASEFVTGAREPFFALWAPMSPHGPFKAPSRHRGKFNDVELVLPPSFAADVATVTALTRTRLDMMLAVEDGLRSILDALEKRGVAGRTFVFFTSDHGLFMGEHGFSAGKGELYEETTRVPLFIRGPGVPAVAADVLVANHDLAPTFLDIAGVPIPAEMDGRSLAPLLRGESPRDWRNAVLLESWEIRWNKSWRGLRTAGEKYAVAPGKECAIFSLARDPYELDAVACGERESEALAAMQARATCRGRDCVRLEDAAMKPAEAAEGGVQDPNGRADRPPPGGSALAPDESMALCEP